MNRILLSLLAVAVLAGCTKRQLVRPEGGDTPVSLSGKALQADTKTAYDGAVSTANPLTAQVVASQVSGDYAAVAGGQYAFGTMTFTGSSPVAFDAGAGGMLNYPMDNSNLYLCGLFPSQSSSTPLVWSNFGMTAEAVLTGCQDLMSAPEVMTNKQEADAGTFKTLAFSHLLTYLEVRVAAESAGASSDWGALQEVVLTGSFGDRAVVRLQDGTVSFAGSRASWPTYVMGGDTPYTGQSFTLPYPTVPAPTPADIKAAAQTICYTMAPPVTADATPGVGEYTIAVTSLINGTPVTRAGILIDLLDVNGNPFTGTTQGYKFVVTLSFVKNQNIRAAATVTPWVQGGSADADVD